MWSQKGVKFMFVGVSKGVDAYTVHMNSESIFTSIGRACFIVHTGVFCHLQHAVLKINTVICEYFMSKIFHAINFRVE